MVWNNHIDFFPPLLQRHQRKKKFLPITVIITTLRWSVALWYLLYNTTHVCMCVCTDKPQIHVCTWVWGLWVPFTHSSPLPFSPCLPPPHGSTLALLTASPWWQDRNSCNKLPRVLFPLHILKKKKVKVWKTEVHLYRAGTTTFLTSGKLLLDEGGGKREDAE